MPERNIVFFCLNVESLTFLYQQDFLTSAFLDIDKMLEEMSEMSVPSIRLYILYFNRPNEWQHLPVHLRPSALPVHLRPLPIHPGAQLHLKPPAVLVQVACLSQLWAPISHSLTSDKETNKKLCKEK